MAPVGIPSLRSMEFVPIDFTPIGQRQPRNTERSPQESPITLPEQRGFTRNPTLRGSAGGAMDAGSVTLLQEAQHEMDRLKFEIAALRKYLQLQPKEQREVLEQWLAALKALPNLGAEREKERLNRLVVEYEAKIKDYERELQLRPRDAVDQMEHLRGENQRLRRQLEGLAPDKFLQEENNNLKLQVEALKRQSTVPQGQVSRLEAEVATLERRLAAARDDLVQLQLQLEELHAANRTLKAAAEDSTYDAGRKQAQVDALRADLEEMRRSRDARETRGRESVGEETRQELAQLRLAAKQLETQKDIEVGQAQSAVAAKEAEAKRAAAELERCRDELQRSRAELVEREAEERLLRAQIALLSEARRLPDGRHSRLELQLDAAREAENRARSKCAALADDNAALREKLARAKNDLLLAASLLPEAEGEYKRQLAFYADNYNKLVVELEEAEADVERLREELRLEQEQMGARERRHAAETAQLEDEVLQLRARIRQSEATEGNLFRLQSEVKLARDDLERAEEERRRLETQLRSCESELFKKENELMAMERQVEQMRADAQRLKTEASMRGSDLEFSRLLKEKSRLAMELEEKDAFVQELRLRAFKLESAAGDRLAACEALEAQLRALTKDHERLMALKEDEIRSLERRLLDRAERLGKDRHDWDRAKDTPSMRYELNESKNRVHELEEQLRFLKIKEDKTETPSAIVVLLENQLEDARSANKALTEKLSQRSDRESGLETQLAAATRKIADLSTELSQARLTSVECDSLKTQLREAQKRVAELTEELLVANSRRNELLRTSNKDDEYVSELQAQLETAKRRIRELSQAVSADENVALLEARVRDLHDKAERVLREKLRLEETLELAEAENNVLRLEKVRLENRASTLSQDLSRTTTHCTQLANLVNKMKMADYEKSTRLEPLRKLPAARLRIELELYKLRYKELSQWFRDLQAMREYTQLRAPRRRRLTFKAVALGVLGAIKMKNRMVSAERTRLRLETLEAEARVAV